MRRLLVGILLVSLLASAGPAQNSQQGVNPRSALAPPAQQQPPTGNKDVIRVAVDLVLVDVRVTDRSGKPIRGIEPAKFTLLENEKPQKISSLEYYDIEAIETAKPTNDRPIVVPLGTVAPPAEPERVRQVVRDHRLLVLFFDLTTMEADELLRARDAAEHYLREQISPADLVAVAVFGNQLKVAAPFTNDRNVLLRVIRSLRPGKESQLAPMADAAPLPGQSSAVEDKGTAFTPDETEFNIFNTDRKLAAIASLAELLRSVPGKKSVIHFTGGIIQTGDESHSQLRAATDAANRANTSLYTVDARGLFTQVPGGDASHGTAYGSNSSAGKELSLSRATQAVGMLDQGNKVGKAMFRGAAVFEQTASRHNSRETLSTLAIDTGGRAFFDLNDLGDVFRKVQAENNGYYLLGYYSTNGRQDGRWRRVRVKVDVPGARVRYREGYYARQAFGPATAEDRDRQILEAMRTEAPRVELPVAVETGYFRLNDKEIFVPIAAKLPSNSLEWASKRGKREANFDFAAEIRNQQSNRVVGALRDTIKVILGTERFQQVQQRALLYQGGVVLPPGNYRLKFIVRENETGRMGSFEEDLALPPVQRDRLELSSMLLSSQLEPVHRTSEVTRKSLRGEAKLKTTPLEVASQRIVPSVTHMFTTQQELYVFFQAYLPEKVDGSKLRTGLVFFRNGQWSSETSLSEPAEVDARTQTASFRVSLPLEKFVPGLYTVQAVVVEDGGDEVAFGRKHFAVRLPPPQTPTGQ